MARDSAMDAWNEAFINKFGRLPRTASEDPLIGELGEFYPSLNPKKKSR
jgi:hypothetical protein